jgi:hypothetical protein
MIIREEVASACYILIQVACVDVEFRVEAVSNRNVSTILIKVFPVHVRLIANVDENFILNSCKITFVELLFAAERNDVSEKIPDPVCKHIPLVVE